MEQNAQQKLEKKAAPTMQDLRDDVEEKAEIVSEARRDFFKVFGVGAVAASGVGGALFSPEAWAYGGPYASAFMLDRSRLFMNIGTTGSTPREVIRNIIDNTKDIARDPRTTFSTQEMRNTIAAGFGADPNEVVMSFNTTDGMSKIMAGLVLQPGDEILTTNMEHPGGNGPMAISADRTGAVLKRVNLPTNDAYSDDEVLARFEALRTDKTKVIVFSSPPYLTGIRLPEKRLCEWAANNGIISVIDGAHGIGMINLDFHDMGVDFYAGAGHKWQCGPGQTGILYIRNNFAPAAPDTYTKDVTVVGGAMRTLTLPGYANTTPLPAFFPTISAAYSGAPGSNLAKGVRAPTQNVALTMMSIGNPSYPALRALQECCTLWDQWGRQAIEDYIVSLAQYLRGRLVQIWGPRSLAAPYDPTAGNYARVALTSFNPFSPGFDYNADLSPAEAAAQTTQSGNAVTALRENQGIVVRNTNAPHSLRSDETQNAIATSGGTSSRPLRISTHLFHKSRDIDKLINALLLEVPHP